MQIRLREARLDAALSQHELARQAGVTQAAISQIERHLVVPQGRTQRAIAKALGVPHGVLFVRDRETSDGTQER